ncbi:MAG: IPT/TIG domain-containing protein [Planctomycetales bacterium]|nr:IPT/TIG domain-containing protein [Planctomycetales bacterium]
MAWLAALATLACDRGRRREDPPPPLPLAIQALQPLSGASTGGTRVTITGRRFAAGSGLSSVTFAGSPGSSLLVVNDSTAEVTTPAAAAGPADVVVANASVGESATETAGFTFLSGPAPAPTVSSVAPSGGAPAGGTPVTVRGTGFQAGATAAFGGSAATGVTALTAGRISATTPAGPLGPVAVSVTNPDTQSGSLPNGFVYSTPPAIAGVAPTTGFTAGGDAVTITGTGFAFGATADLGGAPVAIASATSTTIVGTTTARAPGNVAATVTNPGGISGSGSAFLYRYGPNAQTASYVFDTSAGIDCTRRWYLDFSASALLADLQQAGLQTSTPADAVNAYALDWFRAYVLRTVNVVCGRNGDGSRVSGSSLNATFTGLPPGSGNPGCAMASTDWGRLCVGGCAPIAGCTSNAVGCAGPTVGLSLFDNGGAGPCNSGAEDNCTAPQFGGSGCRGVFSRDIATIWGGVLSPALSTGDMAYLDGTAVPDARSNALHDTLKQLARRVAFIVAHECAHSMGVVASGTGSPCAVSGGLCGGTTGHNDCCGTNVMIGVAALNGTLADTSRAFSGQPGSLSAPGSCYAGGVSDWTLLQTFVGTSP